MKRLKQLNFKIDNLLFYFLSFVYIEFIVRAFTANLFVGWGLLSICVFSAIPAFLLSAIVRLVGEKVGSIVAKVIFIVFFVIYATQVVYHGFFGKYLIVFSFLAGGAAQIIQSGLVENTLAAILKGVPAMILISLPSVFLFLSGDRFTYKEKKPKKAIIPAVSALVVGVAAPLVISAMPSVSSIQSGAFDPNISAREFGLLYTEVLDIKYNLLGIEQELELETEEIPSESVPEQTPTKPEIDRSPNIMNIDFAALSENEKDSTLQTLNSYFAAKEPTDKNEYTGMYKGYNLITVTAEGFSPYAVDPILTPTLYKMSQDGFKFENFYTPIWGVSTSDGEYTACTGLIPKSGVWSFYRSGSNYMPFCLGNMFNSIGVKNTFAYHNHSYTYYHRNISHPNMGYTYKGLGGGLEGVVKQWPESDLEMINGSMDDYISSTEPFHAYYMTVSGHLNYTKIGNKMAAKNWSAVENLECSDTLKAYYACNIELDKAMEALLKRLNEEGIADKTVIMITPDHYPYGLEQDGEDTYAVWRELLGRDVETTFELYKSNLILYCQGTEDAPTIDKYCYSVDILPTLLNLFGFEYDSRLLMGSDILSNANQLVIFSDRSFITEKGKYDANTKEFMLFEGQTPFADAEEEKKYVDRYKNLVNNKFQISAKILDTDYYGYLFEK